MRRDKIKLTRREFINKKHGKAYRTLLRNIKERRKQKL